MLECNTFDNKPINTHVACANTLARHHIKSETDEIGEIQICSSFIWMMAIVMAHTRAACSMFLYRIKGSKVPAVWTCVVSLSAYELAIFAILQFFSSLLWREKWGDTPKNRINIYLSIYLTMRLHKTINFSHHLNVPTVPSIDIHILFARQLREFVSASNFSLPSLCVCVCEN